MIGTLDANFDPEETSQFFSQAGLPVNDGL